MRALRRMTSVGLVVVAALAASIAPTSAASRTTRWVDNDGRAGPGGCNGSATAAKKIQKAIDASNQDDTVIVCPGTYVEQVTIRGNRDGLTLRSSTPFGATIKSPSSLDGSQGFTYIVGVLETDDITIQGFKAIARTAAPCVPVAAAIAAIGSRRFIVRGNRVMAPGTSSGACFLANGIALQDGGLTPGDGRSSSASFTSNEVRDVVGGSILVAAFFRPATATIAGNSVRAYFGASPSGATSLAGRQALAGRRPLVTATPLGAPISGAYAIAFGGKVKGSIVGNVIQGSGDGPTGGPTFFSGIYILGANGTPPFSNGPIDIRDNLVRRVTQGVNVLAADEVSIRHNTFTNVVQGLALTSAEDGVVRRNSVSSKSAGITVDGASSGNAIRDNDFAGNGGTCDDDSSGGGSQGTANTWTGNTATVSDDPNGICPTP
jgi:parallel beta-helix repeat protein